MNLNVAPSPLDVERTINEDQDHNPHFSCRIFFDSTDRDRTRIYNHHRSYYPHHHPQDDCDTNKKVDNGLKLTLWNDPVKREPEAMDAGEDQVVLKLNSTSARNKSSSSLETDLSSNSSCNVVTITPTIRVCFDCNTTKTPLWRSGPKGPKSLCNACGIRQRKARRAMAAAAAAAATGLAGAADPPPVLKIRVQQQNKQKMSKIGHGKDSKFKKRSEITATASGSSSSFEDFLIKLSKKYLSFHRVFPQDEKDAAILLMALSSGLVHG